MADMDYEAENGRYEGKQFLIEDEATPFTTENDRISKATAYFTKSSLCMCLS